MRINSPYITGSATITGNLCVQGTILGTITGVASTASYAETLDGLDSTQFVQTGSFNSYTSSASSSIGSLSGSVATTTSGLSSSIGSLSSSVAITTSNLSSSIGSLSGSVATTTSGLSSSIGDLSSSVATTTSGLSSSVSSSIGSLSGSVATTTSGLGGRITTIEGNYATTGSNTFIGNQVITGSICSNGNIVTTGQIVAQTINVQQVTSSIVYSCGSNIFGTSISNTQQFTGSILATGSLTIAGPLSATTIYGSTAVCSPVGKFTSCVDAGSGTFSGNVLINYPSCTTTGNAFARLGASNTNATQQDYNISELYVSAGNGTVYGGLVASYSSTYPTSTPSVMLRNAGDGPLYFSTNGSIKQTITSGGNVIVGATTSDLIGSFKFISVGNSGFQYAASTGTYLRIEPGAADTEVALKADARSGGYPPMTFYTSATERMRITSGGNVVFNGGDANGWYAGFSNSSTNFGYMGATTQFANSGGSSTDFGIRAANSLAFYTSGGNERMRINSGGCVGIGTCTTNYPLDVLGGGGDQQYAPQTLQIRSTNGTSGQGTGIRISSTGGSKETVGILSVENTAATNGDMVFRLYNGGATMNEKMRITCGGDVLIGCGNVGGIFIRQTVAGTVDNNSQSIGNNGINFMNRVSGVGLHHIIFNNGNNIVGSITSCTTATQFNTTSDYRLKTDLKNYNGICLINQIKTYDFAWKLNDARTYGVIAHELSDIIPYAVTGEKDALDERGCILPQAVDYSKIVTPLIKAVQEQQCTICSQASMINTLKSCLGIA